MTITLSGWEEFIGQAELKARLQVHIKAALEREERLDHIFLAAPPGAGKTSLAALIAAGMYCDFISKVAPIKIPVLRSIVREFEGILLIDEIHRMSKSEQESILVLLSEHRLESDYGTIENNFMTIIGATTEPEKVILPLKDRFPIAPPFAVYSNEEMSRIVQQMGHKMDVTFSDKNAKLLAVATNGIPRHAEQFVIAARDLGTQDANRILVFLQYTPDGLSRDHVKYINLLCRNDVMGLEVLATNLQLTKQSVILLEKVLVDKGLLTFSKSGRVATTLAHKQHKGK